jgi:GNAT superfamily N-acetyltransferase
MADVPNDFDIELRRLAYDDPTVQVLVQAMAKDLASLYGPGTYPAQDPAKWAAPEGTMLIVWAGDQPAGCGGFVRHDRRSAEVKRLFVRPAYRRRGIARRLLTALAEEAVHLHYDKLVLETGTLQHAAQVLYRAAGFHAAPCWPPHDADPTSVCFSRTLRG